MNMQRCAIGVSLVSALLIQGCVSPQTSQSVVPSVPVELVVVEDRQSETTQQAAWNNVVFELLITAPPTTDEVQATGPSLIAGDWLAIQCALAGGYWDLHNQKDAPVFAEAPESWFRLE